MNTKYEPDDLYKLAQASARNIPKSEQDDYIQNFVIAAWRVGERANGKPAKSYQYKTGRHTAYALYYREKTKKQVLPPCCDCVQCRTLEKMIDREECKRIADRLSILKPVSRVVLFRWLDGEDVKEIAKSIDRSVNRTWGILKNARQSARKVLEGKR